VTISSSAAVPTGNASRYLQQLCKHWAHDLEVEFDAAQGKVKFPKDGRGADWPEDAIVTFTAQSDALVCRIEAGASGQLDGLKGAVARHLDRFAFREAPLSYVWTDE
jgi:hypothetical protein